MLKIKKEENNTNYYLIVLCHTLLDYECKLIKTRVKNVFEMKCVLLVRVHNTTYFNP